MSEKQRELNRKQKDILSKPSEIQKENILLKKEVEELKNDLTCFIKSTETFQNILGSQKESAKESGLGFKDPSKIVDRLGHNESTCFLMKKLIRKNKINLSS